jgi:hypothetical protein
MSQRKLGWNKWVFILGCILIYHTSCFNPLAEGGAELGGIFPDVDYDKAIAYHFEDLNGQAIVLENGKLNKTIKKQKELTEENTRDFLQTINSAETYGAKDCGQCFLPRFGVVFYKEKEVAAHISICLECGHQKASVEVGAQANVENGNCYSAVGLGKLTKLCKKLGFGQCD